MIHQPNSTAQFYQSLKQSHCSFVEFYNPSLQCCKQMNPYIQSACKQNGIHLIKANTDKVPNLKNAFNVDTIPTYLIVDKQGKILDSKPGAQKDHVMKLIEECKECNECK